MTPQQKYQQKCREQGKCPCSRIVQPGYSRCPICRERRKNEPKERRKLGLCISCPEPIYNNRAQCFAHLIKQCAATNLGSSQHGEFLADLLLTQNEACIYCQTHIEITVNAELDHIKPVSKYPDLKHNLDNVQWLCTTCNQAKRNMNHNEFITWASKLVISLGLVQT